MFAFMHSIYYIEGHSDSNMRVYFETWTSLSLTVFHGIPI